MEEFPSCDRKICCKWDICCGVIFYLMPFLCKWLVHYIMSSKVRKTKTSKLWRYFKPIDEHFAICNMCKQKLSYKTSTSNLKKHIQSKHPSVKLPDCLKPQVGLNMFLFYSNICSLCSKVNLCWRFKWKWTELCSTLSAALCTPPGLLQIFHF